MSEEKVQAVDDLIAGKPCEEHGMPGCDCEHPIARYYREKQEEAHALFDELQAAKERGEPYHVIKRLEKRLESARYTGD